MKESGTSGGLERRSLHGLCIAGSVLCGVLASCAGAPSGESVPPAPIASRSQPVPADPLAAPPAGQRGTTPTAATHDSAATKSSAAASPPPARPAPGANAAQSAAPAAKSPPRLAPSSGGTEPAAKNQASTPAVTKPAAPPQLDLASLEKRLKETTAIGLLTKIALKNQVDDLLSQFRAYYQGKTNTSLAQLRQPYDLLILKVLALLQNSDPSLANAIVASRGAIWDIPADRTTFATI